MADSSWDNSGLPARPKGMPLWLKVILGCGVLMMLLFGGCVGGCYYLGHLAKSDPKGFEKSIQGFAGKFIKDDWDEARRVVDQLQTDDGTKALYKANPGLAETYPTEAAFLEAAKGWRPHLAPLPADLPDLDKQDLSYQNNMGGRTVLSYRNADGGHLRLAWTGSKKHGDRTLVEISVD